MHVKKHLCINIVPNHKLYYKINLRYFNFHCNFLLYEHYNRCSYKL